MIREDMSPGYCILALERFGVTSLLALAENRHEREKALAGRRTPPVVLRALLSTPDNQSCAVVLAVAGATDPLLNGLFGMRIKFEPGERAAALAETARVANVHEQTLLKAFEERPHE